MYVLLCLLNYFRTECLSRLFWILAVTLNELHTYLYRYLNSKEVESHYFLLHFRQYCILITASTQLVVLIKQQLFLKYNNKKQTKKHHSNKILDIIWLQQRIKKYNNLHFMLKCSGIFAIVIFCTVGHIFYYILRAES